MTNSKPLNDQERGLDKSEIVSANKPQPKDSYVKLAMRNMVKKGGKSLKHFFLTTIGLLTLLVGLAYLTKP